MLTCNLHDVAFQHLQGSSVHGKTAKRIQWERAKMEWGGVTVFTDAMLTETNLPKMVKSRVKVGWLMEPREYRPQSYERALKVLDAIDLLLTHDQALIDARPDKVRFVPFGGCWVPEADWSLCHTKTRELTMIYSAKRFLPGHGIRHRAAEVLGPVRCFGSGTGRPISYQERAAVLASSKFSVVIENSRARNFFTEKLLDCFAVGTIPIYWGCPNIGDFFNINGIIGFEKAADLPGILADLDYAEHEFEAAARDNFERMKQYEVTEDYFAPILEAL